MERISNCCSSALPVSDFIQLQTRKVLTINHVFEIIVHVHDGCDWDYMHVCMYIKIEAKIIKIVMIKIFSWYDFR